MKRVNLFFVSIIFSGILFGQGNAERKLWLQHLDKLVKPVLENLASGKLKENMPVELAPKIDNAASRTSVSYLEAFGRTLSGIAPWLNLEGGDKEEVTLRDHYRGLTLKAIANAVNPASKDYMRWDGGQSLVDASFMAFGLVRCPWLWQNMDSLDKSRVLTAFKSTRATIPVYSNWILFSGMIETFFCKYGYEYDALRIEYAVREFVQHWYAGDGMFSDGMHFNVDYYNSYVIQPYLSAILEITGQKNKTYQGWVNQVNRINKRYAEIQERNINADGSFPAIGRSIVYRGAAFHHLADMSLRKQLPASLKPAQVREGLFAVIKKTMNAPKTFNEKGWLNIGLCGQQPSLADFYITTGSLYLCANIFLPLGLPATDEFWSAPPEPWTAVKIWSGQDAEADHAVDINLK